MNNNNVNVGMNAGAQTSTPVSNQGGAKKKSSILTVIFAITTLGFAGAFAWAMLRDNGGTKANTAGSVGCAVTEEEVAKAEEGTVAEIVADYDEDKEVKDLIVEMKKSYDNLDVKYSVYTTFGDSVVTKLESGVLTSTTKGYGLNVTPSQDHLLTYSNATKEFLTSKGFSYNDEYSDSNLLTYDKGDIRCRFTEGVGPTFGVSCSNVNWVSSDTADLVNALHDAYVAKAGESDDKYVFFGKKENIKTSTSGKYEYIQATIGRANSGVGSVYALFYREVGASEWSFVLAGNGIPSCSEFDAAATEAFAGSGFGCSDGPNIKKVGE